MGETLDEILHKIKNGKYSELIEGKGNLHTEKATFHADKLQHILIEKPCSAIILYPSFCCPLITEPGKALTLFLLANEALAMQSIDSMKMQINLLLEKNNWANRSTQLQDFKIQETIDNMFFKEKSDILKNIYCTKPKDITHEKELLLYNTHNDCLGRVRSSQLQHYIQAGYPYLIRVTIFEHNLKKGMYNISFATVKDTEALKSCSSKDKMSKDVEETILEEALKNYRTKLKYGYKIPQSGSFDFTVQQNDPIQIYHPVYIIDKPYLGIGHLTDVHICARQELLKKSKIQVIPGAPQEVSPYLGDTLLSCFDALKDLLDQMGGDSDIDMLFITGDLIDYNLNLDPSLIENFNSINNQEIWELLRLRKKHESRSPNSNKNCNTIQPQSELEATHTPGIDDIIVYSLIRYFYDTYQKPVFMTSGNHDAYGTPFGISPRFRNAAHKQEKFIKKVMNAFVEAGKEIIKASYNLPYGFNVGDVVEKHIDAYKKSKAQPESPSVPIIKKTIEEEELSWRGARLNAGIPMDHNLTIYEAILVFGPGAMDVTSEVNKNLNFYKEHANIFYALFSPLTDFSFTYKTQTFTGLEWGDDERVFKPLLLNVNVIDGITLPRANLAFSENQIKILDDACKRAKFKEGSNILFSHATLINYNTKIPLLSSNEKAALKKVLCVHKNNDTHFNYESNYDVGSFNRNRDKIYEKVVTGELTHTFSGHTHRTGLYLCEQVTKSVREGENSAQSDELQFELAYNLLTRGIHLQNKASFVDVETLIQGNSLYKKSSEYKVECNKRTRMIVTGSGGPIPIQNVAGELNGAGLDVPQGTGLIFKNGKDYIKIFHAKHQNAKPRLAAALDNYDLINKGVSGNGVFKLIKVHDNTIEFILDEGLRDLNMIEEIKFYYEESINKPLQGITTKMKSTNKKGRYHLTLSIKIIDFKKIFIGDRKSVYMCLNFSEKIKESFLKTYNVVHPWIIRLGLYRKYISYNIDDLVNQHELAWVLERHSKYGEIPSWSMHEKLEQSWTMHEKLCIMGNNNDNKN